MRQFAEHLAQARRLAARLEKSLARMAPMLPLTDAALDALDDSADDALDAFLKRWDQLADLIENRLFRGLASLEGEDLTDMSKRDIAMLMERWGVLDGAAAWTARSIPRERRAHDVNQAHAGSTLLLNTLRGVEARVRSRGLADI
ncbi:MAG: hypothetical protein HQL41_10175 [Alphaproteobacteria bacterium]|nr:hypothetical protein [Alphaproteobacteria bacterium]